MSILLTDSDKRCFQSQALLSSITSEMFTHVICAGAKN